MSSLSAGVIHVLHVDDEPDFTEMAAEFLTRESDHLAVETAADVEEGLDRLASNGIDCIVSDYDMPDRTGIEFLEAVREDSPDLPFILFTGKGSEDVASRAISSGVTDYLQKRVGTEQYALLANRIENAVRQHRATRRADTLDRIRHVVRAVNQALIRAETRAEIEQRVCECLSDAEAYRFAWIGALDTETQTVEPRASAGIEEGYLDAITITVDEHSTAQGPTGRAIRNRELVVMQNIPEDPAFEPWRAEALERGYRSSAAIPLGHNGTVYGVLNVYADRTDAFDDRERALLRELSDDIAHALYRAELREHQTRAELIIENLPVGVYTTSTDSDGRLIEANSVLAEIFDADSLESLADRPVVGFYQDANDREALLDELDREGVVRERVLPMVTLDDEPIWVSVTAIRRAMGDGEYIDGILQDVTARKEREQELGRYKRIVEELNDIPTVIEPDGTITYVSPSVRRVLGYEPEALIGETGFEYQPPETSEAVARAIERVLENPDESQTVQTRFQRADGSWCWIESTLQNRLDDAVINGILVNSRDIHDRKQNERELRERTQELQRHNERLEEFASIVSHDLRNPLNVAEGRLELVRDEFDSDDLDRIAHSLSRMERIIEDMLWLARMGQDIGSTAPVDLRTVLTDAWSNVVDDASASEMIMVDDESWKAVAIEADHDRLGQLLENLFRNAIEHGGDAVTVRVGKLDEGFYVEDDGPGIPEADRAGVFDAGYSTLQDGAGFGLPIVKQVVEAHGWQIRVTEGTDGGARFEMTGVESDR